MTILLTATTGNVGSEVLHALQHLPHDHTVLTAGRHPTPSDPNHRLLDFEDASTYASALTGVDYAFLLRPPMLTSVTDIFGPLVKEMVAQGVKGVVFLSVYGADRMRFVPHHAIEAVIAASGLSYYFLRPTYFMQNLTTTLYDQVKTGRLLLPAGDTPFNWIDVRDIGRAAARLLIDFPQHPNDRLGIELATYENLDFGRVAERSQGTALAFTYQSVSVPTFLWRRRQAGDDFSYAAMVAAIHYLQRLQKPVMARTDWRALIGREPHTLDDFFRDA